MEWHQDNLIFVELLPMVNRIAMAMIWATIWALLGKQFILVFGFKYFFSTDCAVMTEGGTYLLVSNRNAWKLGVCGWEELPGIAIGNKSLKDEPICGTVPGGAMFCSSSTRECQIYHDETDTWTQTANNMPNSHKDGKLVYSGGYAWAVGYWYVDRYDFTTDSWESYRFEDTGIPRRRVFILMLT